MFRTITGGRGGGDTGSGEGTGRKLPAWPFHTITGRGLKAPPTPQPPKDAADDAPPDVKARVMLAQLRGYWESLREGEDLPRRAQVHPRALEDLLGRAMLLDRIAPGIARFRIAGSELGALFGFDLRGMPASALFEPASREPLAALMEEMFSRPAILHLTLAAEGGAIHPPLLAQLVLCPLRDDHGGPLAIGCLAGGPAASRGPRRFRIADSRVEALGPVTAEALPGFAAPAPAFSAAPRPRHPHLRLVTPEG